MGRRLAAVLLVPLVALALYLALLREDDVLVDPSHPRARQAIAIGREVVPGQLVDVRRDRDSGKWEVTLRQGAATYEVELAPDLALLGVDYD